MKAIVAIIFLIVSLASCSNNESAQQNPGPAAVPKDSGNKVELAIIPIGSEAYPDSTVKSVRSIAEKDINGRHLAVNYYSPAVRGRIIWGGLVPMNKPWVTGAHNATSLESGADLIINGKTVPAGKYALFTIPSVAGWTLIINKNWKQHLTDSYSEREDIVRVTVKPDSLDYVQERLRWAIDQTGEYKGTFDIRWEKVRLLVPFEIKH